MGEADERTPTTKWPSGSQVIRMKLKKDTKGLCTECFKHRALFRYGGKVKRDSDHNLCFGCYHSLRNMHDVQR